MSTTAELLARHKPVLKYDSQESYFADSAAQWTDSRGNRLTTGNGQVLASAGHALRLGYLGPQYSTGRVAAGTDMIGAPSKRYREQARALHQEPAYANRVYGHAVTDDRGALWLQYWFWYFYNDYNLIGSILKAGLHEGDWEMIQIRLGADEGPDRAVYAQHKDASERAWSQVDVVPGTQRPLVYVARGSHASYFEPGTHWTGHWFDHADGKRRSPELRLEIVLDGEDGWHWMRWPGTWGDTRKSDGNPLDSDSPRSPGCHERWDHPLALSERAAVVRAAVVRAARAQQRPVPPPAPWVRPEMADGHVRVHYTLLPAPSGDLPSALVVTINSPEEAAPPTSEAFAVETATGCVELTTAVDPARRYDVYASAATAGGLASESVRADLTPAR